MSVETNPLQILNVVDVATPCSADWNEMEGDEMSRFCGECSKRVYNLSAMTAEEAESFILESETTPCIRMFRRQDGTLINQDCPNGFRKAGRWMKRAMIGVFVAGLSGATVVAGMTASMGFSNTSAKLMQFFDSLLPSRNEELMGDMVMGIMVCPAPNTNRLTQTVPPPVPLPEELED